VIYSPHPKVSPSSPAANLQGHFQQRPVLATASLSSFVDFQQLPLRKLLSLVEQISSFVGNVDDKADRRSEDGACFIAEVACLEDGGGEA
jgi:hypothetical protein